MELDKENPSEINSFLINGIHRTDVIDFKRKRKLQAELLGLPISKHVCAHGSLLSKSLPTLVENPELESFQANAIDLKANKGTVSVIPEHESAKDSNSFAEDSDSAMSEHVESKFESKNGKMFLESRPSPSSFDWGSCSSKTDSFSMDSASVMKESAKTEPFSFVSKGYQPFHNVKELHATENLNENPIEYGSHIDYLGSGGYADEITEFTEEEIENMLISNETNPDLFVLSSGRWSVDQASQQGKRKPTIDQEFEQYFSGLML